MATDISIFKISFEIHDLPKLPNQSLYRHWRIKQRENDKWKSAVHKMALFLAPPNPLDKAHITFIRHSSRQPDYDGLVSSFKHCLDGLTAAGVISDDSQEVIGIPAYRWEYARPKDGKITVIVEAVPTGTESHQMRPGPVES